MSRFPPQKIPYDEQDRLWMEFCIVLARLKSPDNMHRFLKDIFNRQERMMFIRRLQIAKMLAQGKTYETIMRSLHTGAGTIGKVQRWLEFGREGYKRAVRELLEVETKKVSR